jgi:hypothetical protein
MMNIGCGFVISSEYIQNKSTNRMLLANESEIYIKYGKEK